MIKHFLYMEFFFKYKNHLYQCSYKNDVKLCVKKSFTVFCDAIGELRSRDATFCFLRFWGYLVLRPEDLIPGDSNQLLPGLMSCQGCQ